VVVDHLLNRGADSPAQGKTFLLAPLVRPCVGVVEGQLLPAAPVRQRHRPAFQREHQRPAFLPFLEADPLQPAPAANRLGGRWRAGSNASKPHGAAHGGR
jgi:hypothetical protein